MRQGRWRWFLKNHFWKLKRKLQGCRQDSFAPVMLESGTDSLCLPEGTLNLKRDLKNSWVYFAYSSPKCLAASLCVEVARCRPSISSQTKLEAGVDPERKTEWAVFVEASERSEYLSPRQLICCQEAWKEPKAWRKPQLDLHQKNPAIHTAS